MSMMILLLCIIGGFIVTAITILGIVALILFLTKK